MPVNRAMVSHQKRFDRDKELIRLYAKGFTYQEIANKIGNISKQGVYGRIQYLRMKGVNLPDRNESASRLVEELNHFCAML